MTLPLVRFMASAVRLWWCAECGARTTQIWSQQTEELSSAWSLSLPHVFLWTLVKGQQCLRNISNVEMKGRLLFWTLDLAVCASSSKFWASNCCWGCVMNIIHKLVNVFFFYNINVWLLLLKSKWPLVSPLPPVNESNVMRSALSGHNMTMKLQVTNTLLLVF